jgi:hypothetical protein
LRDNMAGRLQAWTRELAGVKRGLEAGKKQ